MMITATEVELLLRTAEVFVDGCVVSSPIANADTFPDTFSRWVHTGDEVVINEKKELFILDRMKVCLYLFLRIKNCQQHCSRRRF